MTECSKSREENKDMYNELKLAEKIILRVAESRPWRGDTKEALKAVKEVLNIRPAVLRFAKLMEERLKDNDHKSGWEDCTRSYLFHKMLAKTDKLEESFLREDNPVGEAVDIANYAMMIADNSKLEYPVMPCHKEEAEALCSSKHPNSDDVLGRVTILTEALKEIHTISADGSEEERVAAEALWGEPQKKVAGVTITYTYRCGICGRTDEESYHVLEGADFPKASLRSAFRWVNNVLVCDNHRVDVTVDGRMV